MPESVRFPYHAMRSPDGQTRLRPVMQISLELGKRSTAVSARIDSGADISVLPYSIGTALGAVWDAQEGGTFLTGNIARLETRTLVLEIKIGSNDPAPVVFAWANSDNVPLLLGQFNFFDAFNVCFFRADGYFEVTPRG